MLWTIPEEFFQKALHCKGLLFLVEKASFSKEFPRKFQCCGEGEVVSWFYIFMKTEVGNEVRPTCSNDGPLSREFDFATAWDWQVEWEHAPSQVNMVVAERIGVLWCVVEIVHCIESPPTTRASQTLHSSNSLLHCLCYYFLRPMMAHKCIALAATW